MTLLIAPLVGAAIVSGLASLIGGGISAISHNRARKKEIEDEREYNSPASQIARLLEAGISPFGQNYENTTSGGIPDTFSNIATAFSDAVKSAGNTYLSKQSEKMRNDLALQQIALEKEKIAATKEYHDNLIDYYNDRLNIGVTQFGMRHALDRDTFDFKRKVFDWNKKWNKYVFGVNQDWKDKFYTDPNYLGYWQTKNVISQIGARDRLTPLQAQILQYNRDFLSSRNSWYPLIMYQQSKENSIRNKILGVQYNNALSNWNTMKTLLPLQRDVMSNTLKATNKYQLHLLEQNLNLRDFINDLDKLNGVYNSTMENIMDTRSNYMMIGNRAARQYGW